MQELLCISTAAAATQEVKCDLLEAHARGERAYTLFKTERLESDPPKRKFHDPLKKSNLKTFSSLSKKKQVTANGKSVILKTDRSLFGRIIVIAQKSQSRDEERIRSSTRAFALDAGNTRWHAKKNNKICFRPVPTETSSTGRRTSS